MQGSKDGSPAAQSGGSEAEVLKRDLDAFGGDANAAAASFCRGVPVAWLVSWTTAHACWDMPTWKVCYDIIVAETATHHRCRYVEIPIHTAVAGPADVFLSHAWGARWGNLVSAAVEILRPDTRLGRSVCRAAMAGEYCGYGFYGCGQTLPVPCGSHSVTAAARGHDSFYTRDAIARPPSPEDQKRLPFLRYWCLVEIAEAGVQGLPVVCMGGTGGKTLCSGGSSGSGGSGAGDDDAGAAKNKTEGKAGSTAGGGFIHDINMLHLASQCIDVENAGATNPVDRANLMPMLSRVPGGANAVNRLVRRVLHGASISCKNRFVVSSILSDAALGTVQLESHKGKRGRWSAARFVVWGSGGRLCRQRSACLRRMSRSEFQKCVRPECFKCRGTWWIHPMHGARLGCWGGRQPDAPGRPHAIRVCSNSRQCRGYDLPV